MELTIHAGSHEEAMALFGLGDRNLKALRDAFPVQLTGRGTTIRLAGEKEPVEKVAALLTSLIAQVRGGARLSPGHVAGEIDREVRARSVEQLARAAEAEAADPAPAPPPPGTAGDGTAPAEAPAAPPAEPSVLEHGAALADLRRTCHALARSKGQETYVQAILQNEIVFCIGPAGTGKTYLAVHMGVSFLRQGIIRKIILCRPAVEAGERLGFLPGDFQAKIHPYLRPLYDALNDLLDYDQVKRYLEREIIEVIPLAYMRGRTLNSAFIILDEGQNSTIPQMKMFLTRMGMSSRIVVNGDVTQVDLPEGAPSGLIHARKIIREIKGIAWIEMQKMDIVRHPLVRKIVEAYEGAEQPGR